VCSSDLGCERGFCVALVRDIALVTGLLQDARECYENPAHSFIVFSLNTCVGTTGMARKRRKSLLRPRQSLVEGRFARRRGLRCRPPSEWFCQNHGGQQREHE
jgi:hypothetical protein